MVRKTLGIAVVGLTGIVLGYLLFWPVAIDPAVWTPPAAPELSGPYAVNEALAGVERYCEVPLCAGPEDVAVDEQGRIYGGTAGGGIVQMQPDGSDPREIANTNGRALGLDFGPDGRLFVADCERGLLAVDVASGEVEVLATEHQGVEFAFTDDVAVGPDGVVYFSDASRFPQADYRLDVMEHRPHGRLLAFDPETGATRLLLDGLYFANGVAVSPDGRFVLVVETTRYRIQRYWLRGPRKGEHEVFADNLPGFPDGVSSNGRGTYWLALFTLRNPALDAVLPRPRLRKMMVRLPEGIQPQPAHHAFVLGLNEDGEVIANLQHPSPDAYAPVTSVEEAHGHLYLGSLDRQGVARLRLETQAPD